MTDEFETARRSDTPAAHAAVPTNALSMIRARRRGGTILAVYAVHCAAAIAVAWPGAAVLARETRRLPGADAVLFEPGGLYLLEALRTNAPALTSLLPAAIGLVLLTSYFGLLPLAALVHALNRSGKVSGAELACAASRCFGRYSVLLGLSLFALVALVAIFGLTALAIPLRRGIGLIAVGIVLALGILVIAVLGVLHDLARAAVVRFQLGAVRSLEAGARAFARRPVRILLGWTWRLAVGFVCVAAAAYVSGRASIRTRLDLAALLVVHQSVAALLVALRASWLACALRAVATPDPPPATKAPGELWSHRHWRRRDA